MYLMSDIFPLHSRCNSPLPSGCLGHIQFVLIHGPEVLTKMFYFDGIGLDRESKLCGRHVHIFSLLLHCQLCLLLSCSKRWNSLLAGLPASVACFPPSYTSIPGRRSSQRENLPACIPPSMAYPTFRMKSKCFRVMPFKVLRPSFSKFSVHVC